MKDTFASGENGIIKTPKQLLVEAEKKIGEMENERRLGMAELQNRGMMIARLRMAITALAKHFNLTPDDVKKIFEDYCIAEDKKIVDEAKEKFVQDVKDGKKPEGFTVIENPDKPKEG